MQSRRLPIVLDNELYEKLADQAKRNDRDVYQEARAILRRVLNRDRDQRTEPEKQRVG